MIRHRIDKTAYVDDRTSIPETISIGANVQIYGSVSLSEGLTIEPNVIIYGPAEIGSCSYVGPNSIIGFPSRATLKDQLLNVTNNSLEHEPVRIGSQTIIRSNCVLYSNVIIGDHVRFGHNVMIRENVSVGDYSVIGTNVVIDGSCKIGRRVSIQTGVYISTFSTVEDHVFLGPRSILINDRYAMQKACVLVGPIIQQGASIGANATIFPGITVGEGAVVGAGAVVIDDVAPKSIVVGIPAMKLKNVPQDWRIQSM